MKSILLFGGSQGIGRMIGDHFISESVPLSIVARNRNKLEELSTNNAKVNLVTGDISKESDVINAFNQHKLHYGSSPSVVINAAAIQGPVGLSWEVSSADWSNTIDIDLVGSYFVSKHAINEMIKTGEGSIILFSGGGSVQSRPRVSAYGVAKTAVLRFVETVSDELISEGHGKIIINAIAPGAVKTNMTKEILNAGNSAGVAESNDAQKIMESGGTPPEQIISLIEFLSSLEKNKGLTGRLIHVREDYTFFVNKYANEFPKDNGKLRRLPLI